MRLSATSQGGCRQQRWATGGHCSRGRANAGSGAECNRPFPPAGSFDRRPGAALGRGCCGFRARSRPWNDASLTVAWCVCLAFAAGRGSPRLANRPKRSSRNSQTARCQARRRRSPPSKDGRRRRSMSISAAAESGIAWPSGSNPGTRRSTGSSTRCEQPGPPLVSFGGRWSTGFLVRMLSRNMR